MGGLKNFTCNEDLVFDVRAGAIENGTEIILYEENGGDNQQFKLTNRGDGYHSIDLGDTGFSLDIQANAIENGSRVIIYEYHGGDNQLWKKDKQHGHGPNSYIFHSKANEDMVLDVRRGSDPNELIIWECHGGENQIFKLKSC